MNYTPGPWTYKHSESKDAFNVIGTVLGGNYKIARCPYPVYDFEGAESRNAKEKIEAEANAKLIAAAPDLLAALQIVENIKEGLFHGIVWFTKEDELKISNAIKKATQ